MQSFIDRFDSFAQRLTDHPYFVLSFAASLFLALGIGQDGLNLDSTTYSVIARNMIEMGRWFNPTYTPFYHPAFADHPPLVLWVQALFFQLLGAGDSVARIHGALFTLGSVLMVCKLTIPLAGRMSGLLAGVTLLLTYNFMQMGNASLLDGPMTFFVLVALWGIMRMQQNDTGIKEYVITGLALGAAFMSKGVVSAPVWIAVAATALFMRRDWLKTARFWIVPAIAIVMIALYLILDQIYADGHFRIHYFETKVWDRFLGGGPELENIWYGFALKFVKLYLPFSLLLPFGLYLITRKRITLAYPLIVTLAFYLLFYSSAARIYYHYFTPAYALCAPIVALALAKWLKERAVGRIITGFLALWIVASIGVQLTGVRIHQIRSPEVYELTDRMNKLLVNHSTRQGIVLDSTEPDWDYVAKTSWYWRSDILRLESITEADKMAGNGQEFAYLMIPNDESTIMAAIDSTRWTLWAVNDRLTIYVPSAFR